jgi:Spy/CpxP family protein refolding chaperone
LSARVDARLAMRQILTPEQQQKAKDLRGERLRERRDKREKRRSDDADAEPKH